MGYTFKVYAESFKFDPNSTVNEGRYRVRNPIEFQKDRIWSEDDWKGIKADGVRYIVGLLKDGGKALQAVRFKKDKWTEQRAGDWIKNQDIKRISVGTFR